MSQQVKVYRKLQFKSGALTEGERKTIEHHSAADTLTFDESGSIHTNLGATVARALTLPIIGADGAVTGLKGVYFDFVVMAAYALQIDPSTAGGIYINGAKQADDKYISADDEAESVRLTGDGNGDWVASSMIGTWSVQT